jgi:8-oxo-dGTP diphosphatase
MMRQTEGYKQPAVLVILKANNQFLLLKRKKEPNKGKYTPVGGKLDPFETPYKAAIRETFEETGIEVTNMKYCGLMVETSPIKYNWICFVYLSEIDYQTPPECNEGKLDWIPITNLSEIPTPATDKYIYHYVADSKNFMFNVDYDHNLNIIEINEEIENKKIVET